MLPLLACTRCNDYEYSVTYRSGSIFSKASFVVSVVLVLALIQDLNRLTLFERLIGEESARDLLRTIKLDQLLNNKFLYE